MAQKSYTLTKKKKGLKTLHRVIPTWELWFQEGFLDGFFLFLFWFLPDPLTLNKAFLLTSFMAIYLQTQALGHCHLHVLVSSVCLKQ